MPDSNAPAGIATAPRDFRSARAQQLAQARQRHMVLAEHYPDVEPAQLAAMTDDRFWGPDELWRRALESHLRTAAPPINGQKSKRRRWIPGGKKKTSNEKAIRAPAEVVTMSKAPTVAETFTVPTPGGKTSVMGGRIRSWVIRLMLLIAPMVTVAGLAYSCGSVVAASSQSSLREDLIAAQADRWHLSTFPVQQAAAFAQTYLTLCLTHPQPNNSVALTGRLQALAAMTSAGVSSGCGWDGTGGAQIPLSVTWTGTATPALGQYTTGQAARMTFTVALTDGQISQVALPVWSATDSGPTGMRVVGEITVLPYAGAASTAPTPQAPDAVDDNLAVRLQPTVLTPFLQAWGASDPVQLSLTVTSDASAAATVGLSGIVTSPSIDTVLLVVTKGSPQAYRDGDLAVAQTVVEWKTGSAGTQKSAYDIFLRRVGGRWLVTDIAGGPVDQQGGAAALTFITSSVSVTPTS